jgi:6-phosphofructokinase 1
MNAALRAIVRSGIYHGLEVHGVYKGYSGLLEGHIEKMNPRSVANIIQRGGTILKTDRCKAFFKKSARAEAANILRRKNIDALIVIGGDGSYAGAHLMCKENQYPVVGVPGTIDNDIWGTERTIGFDTAVNTALDAIDRIRDTAASHDRLFIVEVMGRNSGFIAAHVGLAGGAEEIFTPDGHTSVDKVVERLQAAHAKGKTSSILITAEGQKPGRAYDLADSIRKRTGWDAKVCILGHQQRGGSPTAEDRILASRMGAAAVEALLAGQCDIMIGSQGDQLVQVNLIDAVTKEKKTPMDFVRLTQILAN